MQWIKCSERMPDFYVACLVIDDYEDMAIGTPNSLMTGETCAFTLNDGEGFDATHWMHLPPPPTE